MWRKPEREKVWGSTGGDRPRVPLVAGIAALLMLGAFAGLGFLMTALLRAGVAGGSPLRTALCLGALMVVFLATSIVLLRAAAVRFTTGDTAQRAVTIGGLAVLMGFAPMLMILVVYLLSRGGAP